MAISTNQKPTIYRNLYEDTASGSKVTLVLRGPYIYGSKQVLDQWKYHYVK